MMTRPGQPEPDAAAPRPLPAWLLRVVAAAGVALFAIGIYLGGLAIGQGRNRTSVDKLARRVAELCAQTPDPATCVRQSPQVVINLPPSTTPPASSPSSSSPTSTSSSSRSTTTASPSPSTTVARSVPTSPSSPAPPSTTSPPSSTTSTTRPTSTILPPITLPPLRRATSTASSATPALVALLGAYMVGVVIIKTRARRRYRRNHDKRRQPVPPAARR